MTQVSWQFAHDACVGFRAHGHAGNAAAGENIVCAAVSALLQSLVLGLTQVLDIEKLALTSDEEQALLQVRLPQTLTNEQRSGAQVLMKTVRLALEDIAAQYPDEIQSNVEVMQS